MKISVYKVEYGKSEGRISWKHIPLSPGEYICSITEFTSDFSSRDYFVFETPRTIDVIAYIFSFLRPYFEQTRLQWLDELLGGV